MKALRWEFVSGEGPVSARAKDSFRPARRTRFGRREGLVSAGRPEPQQSLRQRWTAQLALRILQLRIRSENNYC
jgi:hypothetical protein